VDTYKKGMAIQHLISTYPDLVDMLLGDVPLPRGHITEMIGGTVSYAAATLAAACLKWVMGSDAETGVRINLWVVQWEWVGGGGGHRACPTLTNHSNCTAAAHQVLL
jgi:hypothetical protein